MRDQVFKKSQLVIMLTCAFSCNAWAQGAEADVANLPTVEVVDQKDKQPATKQVITRKALDTEMVANSRDLVRYSTDVGVSEASTRSKGFAVRGVEENRVNMSIDGVALPNLQINSLYNRYGNINSSRLSIDPALVREVTISKGGDSVRAGGGTALGGSVDYKTLEASDLVQPGKTVGGLLKTGYHSRNREWAHVLGAAYRNGAVDMVLAGVKHFGHETQSAGGNITPYYDPIPGGPADKKAERIAKAAVRTGSRIHPDPVSIRDSGWLAKINWLVADNHLLGIAATGQTLKHLRQEFSYHDVTGSNYRHVHDNQKRTNISLNYEYFPQSTWLASVRLGADWQKVRNGNFIKNFYENPYAAIPHPEVDSTLDRNFYTDYKRLRFGMETQPLRAWGEHTLRFNVFTSDNLLTTRDVKDWVKYNQIKKNAIQRPMQTRHTGVTLQDSWKLNSVFSAAAGVGYDKFKITGKAFEKDYPCGSNGMTCGPDHSYDIHSSFSGWNGYIDLNAQLNPNWRLDYSVSTGFRAPSASEMYFEFVGSNAGQWIKNLELKPERSISHTVSINGQGRYGNVQAAMYQTRYKNFIYEDESYRAGSYGRKVLTQQMINVDKAHVRGFDFSGHLQLDQVSPLPQGWSLFGAVGYSKGKLGDAKKGSLLAIQPFKAVLGLDYEAPSGKWGVFSRVSYSARKKPKDALTPDIYITDSFCRPGTSTDGVCPHRWLSKAYTTVDVFGYYTPVKNLTLRAGVFNLLNKKYHTWDALRGINKEAATVNRVDKADQGLQRYYAPGRNFNVSLEYKF